MNPIFLIYTYTEPEIFGRLVRSLSPYRVIAHVDAKVSERPFRSSLDDESALRCSFIPDRVLVNWAGYSQVQAIRLLVGRALAEIEDPTDYIVMLSGQDYPIRPLSELVAHLSTKPSVQYARCFRIAESESSYFKQVDRRHHRDLPIMRRWTRVPLLRRLRSLTIRFVDRVSNALPGVPSAPDGIELAQGPTHFALTAECLIEAESLVTSEFESFMKGVFCPEEKFYQTLVANSKFAPQLPAAGFEPYAGRGNFRYSNLHLIDPTLVRVFEESDLSEIMASGKFFVRKVTSQRSSDLLDLIDARLLTRR